jgi:hypothetical protein
MLRIKASDKQTYDYCLLTLSVAKAFSFLPMVYGIGVIVGPMIGGLLSNPVDNFPNLFGHSAFLRQFPYFLPCAVCACFTTFGFLMAFFFLEETLVRTPRTNTCTDTETGSIVVQEDKDDTPLLSGPARPNYAATNYPRPSTHPNASADIQTVRNAVRPLQQSKRPPLSRSSSDSTLSLSSDHAEEDRPNTLSTAPQETYSFIPRRCWGPVFAGAALAFQTVVFDELLPLWAATPVIYHGLGFRSDQIGTILSISGIISITIQVTLFPPAERCFGPRRLFCYAMLIYAPVYMLFPWISHFAVADAPPSATLWTYLIIAMGFRIACGVMSFTSHSLLVINSARGTSALGTVNGIAMCVQSLARSFGPAFGGAVWSWSAGAGLIYPFNFTLTWNMIAIVSFITSLFMWPSRTKREARDSVVQ